MKRGNGIIWEIGKKFESQKHKFTTVARNLIYIH